MAGTKNRIVELNLKFRGIMGYKKEHVKGNGGGKPKRLMDRVRETMRLKHYSIRTEQSYMIYTHVLRQHGIQRTKSPLSF